MLEKLRATPAARSLAKSLDLDLSKIPGTGARGRIHKEDVAAFEGEKPRITALAKKMAEAHALAWEDISGTGPGGKIRKRDVLPFLEGGASLESTKTPREEVREAVAKQETSTKSDWGEEEVIPMSAMRKVISKRMCESAFSAPAFVLQYEVDMTEALELRKKIQEAVIEAVGVKASLNDFISYALVKALGRHPYINASLIENGEKICFHHYVNLAIAVGMDEGLLTPVVYHAEKMSFSEYVKAAKDVVSRTLNHKLGPQELQGSTFTISNLGMYGVSSFVPIINQPNSAILGVGAIEEKLYLDAGEVKTRSVMQLSLSIDHRVIDGLVGAKFMLDLKGCLEHPWKLFI